MLHSSKISEMKRTAVSLTLEPWSTKEKLCLSYAVLKNGDQNWMSVSRMLRVFGEQDRPSEWYSQKQCALQYEALMNQASATKRKKRTEKGVETLEPVGESIVRRLIQDRKDELNDLMEEERRTYLQLKQEIEDIESGRADDKLDEYEREMEEEKEREAQGVLRLQDDKIKSDSGRVTPPNDVTPPSVQSHPVESKVPTSPLLTSLLQSPSHYRNSPSLHSLLSPTNARPSDSPTLSRLLESPARQPEPAPVFSTPVKKEPIEVETPEVESEPPQVQVYQPGEAVKPGEVAVVDETAVNVLEEEKAIEIQEINEMQMQEVEVEITATTNVEHDQSTANITTRSNEESFTDKESEQNSQNLQDSDLTDEPEQHSMSELDSQMVNMIVAGSAGMISMVRDTSGDNMEVTSTDIQHKDDSEAAESVKEDSLDEEIVETLKEEEVEAEVVGEVETSEAVDVEALNTIMGPETPKDNYVIKRLCSTPENELEDDDKSKSPHKTESTDGAAVVEVEVEGEEMVNLGEAEVVEEEVDTTVHEVEVVVSPASSKPDEETPDSPETDQQDDSQEEEYESLTPKTSNEEMEKEEKDEEEISQKDSIFPSSRTENKSESPITTEDDSESGSKQSAKPRLISGSGCSDSKPNSPATHIMDDSKEYRSWKKSIMLVWSRMATHKYASMFLKPITNEQAPAYDSVIHRPVDLATMKKRIECGELRSTLEFQRDLLLMFQNAIMYNNQRTLVWEMATIMRNECMQHLELMVEAMGEGILCPKDAATEDKPTRGRGEAPKRKRTSVEDKSGVKRRKES